MEKADMGVIGLGVMGYSLSINMLRNGFAVAGFDLDPEKGRTFAESQVAGKQPFLAHSLVELAQALKKPRKILVMVPAGAAVDSVIQTVKPYLDPGDILIDGGNSFFMDTERRGAALREEGIHFVGMGVSGGEQGALVGPSLMPGGPREAWTALEPTLTAIAAKAEDGRPCVAYMGPRGAGHYVKMIHNGIEYGDMQLIAETYDLLRRGLGMAPAEISRVFSAWNQGVLRSYLVEITADILAREDPLTGRPVIDVILDEALQKGTGGWTAQDALDLGLPAPTITAAVESRFLSTRKTQRVQASRILKGPDGGYAGDRQAFIEAAHDALYASKIATYAQGMGLLRSGSETYDFALDLSEIARIWRAGCIIRARLLDDIMDAYRNNPRLVNLMLDDDFREALDRRQPGWRFAVQQAVALGIPVMAMGVSLGYYDAYRSEVLPANLIQAQRDYFGAHTYQRVDQEGHFHTEWTEENTSS